MTFLMLLPPADKASDSIMFVCKTHSISCLSEELGLNTSEENSMYTCTSLCKGGNSEKPQTILLSYGISTAGENLDLPKLYCIPKLHKIHISNDILLVRLSAQPVLSDSHRILTEVEGGLQKYCDLFNAKSGVNQMRVLKQLLKNFWKP